MEVMDSMLMLLLMSMLLSTMVWGVSYMMGTSRPDSEKVSMYECGFDPFGSLKTLFSVSFFLVGMLFVMFDLEVSYMFPWSVMLKEMGAWGFWMMYMFMMMLTVGLMFEWVSGGLEWE